MKVVLIKEKVCHPRFSIRQGMKSISFAIKFIVKQIIDIYHLNNISFRIPAVIIRITARTALSLRIMKYKKIFCRIL